MSGVTEILNAIEAGDPHAAAQLWPLVYDELRQLAAIRMAVERSDHTLDPTALVHEAYFRLVGPTQDGHFANSRHFFAAAAEAIRRILVDSARRKRAVVHGGDLERVPLDAEQLAAPEPDEKLLALDEALAKLTAIDGEAAELVRLRYFAGLTVPRAAELLGLAPRSADRLWAFAKAWLFREMNP